MSRVRSVNVGRPREAAWATIGRTSVLKEAVVGPVAVHELGLAGDEVSNRRHHGGRDKAVYAFAREDLDRWAERLGVEVPDGTFAENLTTEGIDVNEAELGERWRVGGPEGPVLEVASFRTPCAVFQAWMGRSGYDHRAWVRRFADDGRPGPYLRVVVPGVLRAGDAIEVVAAGGGTTVGEAFRAAYGRPGSG
jgi:MOSC domain-containing protein YiiM